MGSEPRSNLELRTAIQALGNKGLGVEGVHVQVRDRPPVEYHWVADIRRDIFSASKTFTSVAIAIAQGEGLLRYRRFDPVSSRAPESAPARSVEAITIRHLLTMTSGVIYRWDDPDADHPGDAAVDILTTPLGTTPGTAFAYRGANSYLLSRIIHACSGQDLRDFLLPDCLPRSGLETHSGCGAHSGTRSALSGSICAPPRLPRWAPLCSKTAASSTSRPCQRRLSPA